IFSSTPRSVAKSPRVAEQCDDNINSTQLIPHHAVVREQRDSTKVRIVFDASSKVLVSSLISRRTLIWRAPGTRYQQENTTERHPYGGAGWLVWGGIIFGSRTDLHVQSVTMTGYIYRDVILEQHVRLFRGAMGAEFLFMDDNARPHRANIVDECLLSEDITRMEYGLDLNSIEHVWDMLGRRIAPVNTLPPVYRKFGGHCLIQNETHQEQLSEYLLNLDAKQIELQIPNKEIEDLFSDKELFEVKIEGSLEYEENINEVRYKIKEDNYKSCLNLLKNRYGRQDHLISCYMNKLLEIEPVQSFFNLKGLRKLHDESEINIRNLDSVGIASGNYGHLLIPIILKQLPHDLVVEFHVQKDSKDIGDVRELMKFIKFEIESRESANIALEQACPTRGPFGDFLRPN
ncbi:transposable element Tcb1 transposase, partial [Trichonephila clavipes]